MVSRFIKDYMEEQNNDYYVYLHRRGDNNEVFYVGKGRQYRAHTKRGRNEWWTRLVSKHGYTIEFLEMGLSESDAYDLEVETIKFYVECGHTLCNMTSGGDGGKGYKHTDEAKNKMRVHNQSKENRDRQRSVISIPVLCSNGMTFKSCKAAEIWLGNSPTSSKVSTCCRREAISTGGYVWRYLHDCEDLSCILKEGKDAFVEFECQKVLDSIKPKQVFCDNGMTFASACKAVKWCKDNGYPKVNSSTMSRCCLRKAKTMYGLQFSYIDEFSHTST